MGATTTPTVGVSGPGDSHGLYKNNNSSCCGGLFTPEATPSPKAKTVCSTAYRTCGTVSLNIGGGSGSIKTCS